MNKKLFIFLTVTISLIVVVLFICNERYSFYPVSGSGWSIGYKEIDNPLIKFDPIESQILDPEWLDERTSQSTRFLADPFLIYEDEMYYIFFEHQAEGNANIAFLKSPDGKNFEYGGEVLDEDFHLSFPQIFRYQGEFFMLPETKQAGNVLLYKAEDFPFKWKIYDTLIKNVAMQDPAILISDSLFLITGRTENLHQFVYTAESLNGSWQRDEKFNIRSGDETRAAGNFFNVEGNWYIPFQKNSDGYGSGVSLYQLIFEEDKIRFKKIVDSFLGKNDRIKWFSRGMHHYSSAKIKDSYFSVFDGDKADMNLPKQPNWKASLKYNFYDLANFFNGLRE